MISYFFLFDLDFVFIFFWFILISFFFPKPENKLYTHFLNKKKQLNNFSFQKMSESYAREMIDAMVAYCVPLAAHCIKLHQAMMALRDLDDALMSIDKSDVSMMIKRTDVLVFKKNLKS